MTLNINNWALINWFIQILPWFGVFKLYFPYSSIRCVWLEKSSFVWKVSSPPLREPFFLLPFFFCFTYCLENPKSCFLLFLASSKTKTHHPNSHLLEEKIFYVCFWCSTKCSKAVVDDGVFALIACAACLFLAWTSIKAI